MFKNKTSRTILIIAAAMILVSSIGGYALARTTASPLKTDDVKVIKKDCIRTDVYNYTVCGKSIVSESEVSSELIGASRAELGEKLGNCRVTAFSPEKITVTHDIRQYCPEHFILLYEDGELLIKQNKSREDALETVTALGAPVHPLKTSVLQKLKKGIVFSSNAAARNYATKDIYK